MAKTVHLKDGTEVLIRPLTLYNGPDMRAYTPMDKR